MFPLDVDCYRYFLIAPGEVNLQDRGCADIEFNVFFKAVFNTCLLRTGIRLDNLVPVGSDHGDAVVTDRQV